MARSLLAIWLLPTLVAALQVNYPLNQQLPPVALVDQPYRYQFAPTTFQADSDNLQYSLIGGPSWLSLDSRNRTLSGTPRTSDLGESSFKIAAASSAGAVVNMNSKLLVSSHNGSEVKGDAMPVPANTGQLSGPHTITIGPSKPIDISYPSDTFNPAGVPLFYYARLSDRTPLPAWISFEASTLHFTGTTPLTTYPQSFEILLVACEVPGYATASVSFTIAVSNHQLSFQPYDLTFNLSKRDEIQLTGLKSKLFLDGSPIQDSQIQSMNATLPSWLRLDNTTYDISGIAPSGLMSQDLTITATDQFEDVAQLDLHIRFLSKLFTDELGQLNATIGDEFKYTIPQGVLASGDDKLSIDFSSLSRYLRFDAATSTISGTITDDFPSQKVPCTLTAMSSDGTQRDTQSFQIAVLNTLRDGHPNITAGSAGTPSVDNEKAGRRMAGVIVGSVVGAICGILLLIAFALCMYRRKKRKTCLDPKLPRSPKKSDIGQHVFVPSGWPHVMDQDHDLEKGEGDHDFLMDRAPEKPPKLDFNLPLDPRDSQSLTDSIGEADSNILDTFENSQWGFQNDIAPSQRPHDSMKIPTEQLAKRLSQRSDPYRKYRRKTTAVYQDPVHRRSDLPVNRRITSMGHSRQTCSPSRRSSLRRPLSASSYNTRCTSAFSTAPSTIPQPPVAQGQTVTLTKPAQERRSIRVVPASVDGNLVDRSMDEKRNSYIRNRALNQSPFFSGAGKRASSSSYKPAFIEEPKRNTIVRPDEDVIEDTGKKLLSTPISKTPTKEFPGSLRNNRVPRPHTSVGVTRDRVEKSYTRSDSNVSRPASTRDSLRSYELKSRLNDLTGSEIFKDAELSDSEYTDEEDEIKAAERRTTVKPGQFTLPPLNIDTIQRSKDNSPEKQKQTTKRDSVEQQKRMSKRESGEKGRRTSKHDNVEKQKEASKCDSVEKSKRKSKRDSQKELRAAHERDPTPFYTPYHTEHGGKENESSSYSLGSKPTPKRIDTYGNTAASASPERPKRTARHSRTENEARKANRASAHRASKAVSQTFSEPTERHSRNSNHLRTQSRQTGSISKKRHSRVQSTSYPYFDAEPTNKRSSSIANAITTANATPSHMRGSKNVIRDLSGNLTFYGDDEEPTVEELGSSSIGFRTSNGRINSNARRSRLASLHTSSQFGSPSPPLRSSKREMTIPPSSSLPSSSPPAPVKSVGLGLFPVDARAELSAADRERTSLSRLQSESRVTPDVEDSGLEVPKGRQTWGSWKSVVGRGSRWVSGGYWDKQGKEDKVFI